MKHENFNMKAHGFVGHPAEPDSGSYRAVIVIIGEKESLLPGIVFAERFADPGIFPDRKIQKLLWTFIITEI